MLILRIHAVGAVCRHSFAMSEAFKIQILFKGTCVKYCSARPKPVGCRHFFKYLFFWGKKMTSSLALQILLRYRAPKILIYCRFLFPPKKYIHSIFRITSLPWSRGSFQCNRMHKNLPIRWFWIDWAGRMYLCHTCIFIHPLKTTNQWQQLKRKAGTVVPTMVSIPPGNLLKKTLQRPLRNQTSQPSDTKVKSIDLFHVSSPPFRGEFCFNSVHRSLILPSSNIRNYLPGFHDLNQPHWPPSNKLIISLDISLSNPEQRNV